MRWTTGRRSSNIEDRRGGSGGMPIALAGGGLGTIVLLVLALFFGVDPSVILQDGGPLVDAPTTEAPPASSGDPTREFLAVVLGDTEDTWHALFRRMNREYREPKLVLFSGGVQSACGMTGSATGPFYCPADEKLYLDVSFFRALRDRFRAPGDFAQAYVIAHEVGHHVQNLLGVLDRRRSGLGDNEASVRRELQADCFAGVWAHHADAARQILESGDVEEALAAASAIGDDRLQREAGRRITPESFTHGTSAQRVRWFKRGLAEGDVRRCDTSAAGEP